MLPINYLETPTLLVDAAREQFGKKRTSCVVYTIHHLALYYCQYLIDLVEHFLYYYVFYGILSLMHEGSEKMKTWLKTILTMKPFTCTLFY